MTKQKSKWGEILWLPTVLLEAPKGIQRKKVNASKVSRLAREWDWQACDPILVSENGNGTYRIIEGSHRVRALLMNHEVEAPCRLVEEMSTQRMATLFYTLNEHRDKLNTEDAWSALVQAGDNQAVGLHKLLESMNFHPGKSKNGFTIKFMSRLIRCWKQDRDTTQIAMEIVHQLSDENTNFVGAHIWAGIWGLNKIAATEEIEFLHDATISNILGKGPLEQLEAEIRQHAENLGVRVHNRIAAMRGVQSFLNSMLPEPKRLDLPIE